MLLISNTIRVAAYSRRRETGIMAAPIAMWTFAISGISRRRVVTPTAIDARAGRRSPRRSIVRWSAGVTTSSGAVIRRDHARGIVEPSTSGRLPGVPVCHPPDRN